MGRVCVCGGGAVGWVTLLGIQWSAPNWMFTAADKFLSGTIGHTNKVERTPRTFI